MTRPGRVSRRGVALGPALTLALLVVSSPAVSAAASSQAASSQAVSSQAVSRQTASGQTASSQAASGQTASRKTPILTGAGMGPGGSGFGQVRPRDIYRGGSGYGVACHIRWAAWGGPLAVGIGTAWYVAPGAATAGGHWALAVVVLYRLGSWHHRPAYTRYRWYFPEGGSLSGGGVEDCLT